MHWHRYTTYIFFTILVQWFCLLFYIACIQSKSRPIKINKKNNYIQSCLCYHMNKIGTYQPAMEVVMGLFNSFFLVNWSRIYYISILPFLMIFQFQCFVAHLASSTLKGILKKAARLLSKPETQILKTHHGSALFSCIEIGDVRKNNECEQCTHSIPQMYYMGM